MSFFGRLFGALFGQRSAPAGDSAGGNAFWLYVECNACHEKIRVRVNREHDLSAEYDGSDTPSSYVAHKEIVGNQCFRRIKVDLTFDSRRQQTEQHIEGGRFISREEFEAPVE
jgi:hypothetical protein